MDRTATIEAVFAGVLKQRGFRKRARNWFRITAAGEYQVVNLQKSSWGGGQCYLNLGWDPTFPSKQFRPDNECALRLRAEETEVIPSIDWVRPDGEASVELPGIVLLDPETSTRLSDKDLAEQLTDVVAIPIADLLDRTPSIVDMVPLLMRKPWFATLDLRHQLATRGFDLPTGGETRPPRH